MARRVASALLLTVAAAGLVAKPADSANAESRVFFASNRSGAWQVYSIRRSGTGLAQLTVLAGSREPVPSPNGRLVLFRRGDFNRELWVMQVNGRNRRRVSTAAGSDAVWAPDSRQVAVGHAEGILVIDVRTGYSRVAFRGRVYPVGWSRDGSVLFAQVHTGCDTSCSLLAVTPDTVVQRQLAPNAAAAALSPDRRSIAYFTRQYGGDLHVVDVRTAIDRLVAADLDAVPLRWSPSGRSLAFVDGRVRDPLDALSGGILLADTVGAGVSTLTEEPMVRTVPAFAPTSWSTPAWSPIGDAVAFAGAGGLRIVTVGGGVRTLFDTARDGSEVADIAWARTPPLARPRPPSDSRPLVETAAEELRFRTDVPSELAADGDRVAFLSCNNPGVWTPSTRRMIWIGPNTCPHALGSRFQLGDLALSNVGTAFGAWTGGGNSQSFSMLVSLPGSVVTQAVGGGYLCCTGGARSGIEVGAALGSGPLLVFSEWTVRCPGLTDPSCASSAGPESVWRVHEDGTRSRLAASPGPIAPLSVDDEHVLVRLGGGRLDVLDGAGGLVRSFGFAPGEATAAELDGDDVVVTIPGLLLHYSLARGVLLHAWPLPRVSSGGFCGAPVRAQCAQVRLRLEDVRAGLAAYLLDGSLHVLRLSDGVDTVVDQATTARFGDTGLFYARDGEPPWPGRIRFRPLTAVAPALGFGSLRIPGKL